MNSAQVCRQFLSGNCRYGNSCKFYHPPRAGTQAAGSNPKIPFQFTADTIRADLTVELPMYFLSNYGPAKYEPNLIYDSDISPEELRWKSVVALKEGKGQEYVAEETTLIANAKAKIASLVLNNAAANTQAQKLHQARFTNGLQPGAARPREFSEAVVFNSNQPSTSGAFGSGASAGAFEAKPAGLPSAFESTAAPSAFGGGGSTFGASKAPAFGTAAPATGGAFGQSAFGASGKPSTFGSSAFGGGTQGVSAFGSTATATPAASGGGTFGQSAFGQKPATSAFGKSGFGGAPSPTAPVAFGSNPSNPSSNSTFGSSAFGQSPKPPTTTAFGGTAAPSAFGQASQPAAAPFGSAAAPSAFGAAAAASPAFGSSGFGSKPENTATSGSAFGKSAFGSTPASAPAANLSAGSAFGQSGFGQTANANPFASQPSAAGSSPSAFGQSAASTPAGGFGAFSNNTTAPPPANTFTSPAAINPFAQPATTSAFGAPPSSSAFSSTSAFTQTPSASPFGAGAGAVGSTTPSSQSFMPQPEGDLPRGWSWDDPWTWLAVRDSEMENGGKLEDEVLAAFQSPTFNLGKIPTIPPPVDLRV